jgi:hypothetical protein
VQLPRLREIEAQGNQTGSYDPVRCLVEDIDVVACDAADKTQREGNQAFLNLRHQSAESVIDGVTLRRLRFDCDIAMLVGFLQVKGTVRNVAFEGVTLHGKINGRNYLRTENAGSIAGMRFRDVTISGAGGSLQWATSGRVAPIESAP